jgi:hypothetical protein
MYSSHLFSEYENTSGSMGGWGELSGVWLCPKAQEWEKLSDETIYISTYCVRKIVFKSIFTQMATMRDYQITSDKSIAYIIRI